MRCMVWFAAVLWLSWLGFTTSELDPGQQAKVSTALDSAQFALNEINEHTEESKRAIEDA